MHYRLMHRITYGSPWHYLECDHKVKVVEEQLNLQYPSRIVAAKVGTLDPKKTYGSVENFKKKILGQVKTDAWFVYPEVQPWWNIHRLTSDKNERGEYFREMTELGVPVVYGYWKYLEKRETGAPKKCGFFNLSGERRVNVGENCMQLDNLIHKKTKIPKWQDANGKQHAEEYSIPAYRLHVWRTEDNKKILPLICAESLYYFDSPELLPKTDLILVNYEFAGPVPEYLKRLVLKTAKKLGVKIVGVIPGGAGLQSFYADDKGFNQGVDFEV